MTHPRLPSLQFFLFFFGWLLFRFGFARLKILDTFDDEATATWSIIAKLDELESWHIWLAALPGLIIVGTPVTTLHAVVVVVNR